MEAVVGAGRARRRAGRRPARRLPGPARRRLAADRVRGRATRTRSPRCGRRRSRSATSRCGSAPCSAGSATGLDGPGQLRRRGRLVLHPGGHRRDRGRRGPGPGAGGPAGQLHHRPGPGRGGPAGRRRVQRRVPAAADLAAVRAGPLARAGRAGVGAVLAGARRRRGRAVPDRGHRRGRHLAAAHAVPRSGRRARRDEEVCRQYPAAGRRAPGHHGTRSGRHDVRRARWSDEGSSRVQLMPVVDPDLVAGSGWARPPTCTRAG